MNRNTLVNGLLTIIGHLSKIISGFVLLKIISHYLGPEGLGFLGHFMSLMTVFAVFCGGGVAAAVVKYVSEFKGNSKNLNGFIGTVFVYSFFFCLLSLALLFLFAKDISFYLFKSVDYYYLIFAVALSQFLMAFLNIVNGVVSGLGQLKIYAAIQLIGMLIFSPVAWIIISNYDIVGAGFAIIFLYASLAIPAAYFFIKEKVNFSFYFDCIYIKKLSHFSVMLLVSAVTFPIFEVFVREQIIQNHGYSDAGIWQGSMRLSSAYMGFFGTFLMFYFMPIISSEFNKKNIESLVFKFLLLVLGVFLFGAGVLYFFRDFFISLILSDKFKLLSELIFYQLLGDLFRVLSYVIGFVGVAKAATKTYIAAEMLQSIFLLFFIYLTSSGLFDLESVMRGYALAYSIYFLLCAFVFIFYTRFSGKKNAFYS